MFTALARMHAHIASGLSEYISITMRYKYSAVVEGVSIVRMTSANLGNDMAEFNLRPHCIARTMHRYILPFPFFCYHYTSRSDTVYKWGYSSEAIETINQDIGYLYIQARSVPQ